MTLTQVLVVEDDAIIALDIRQRLKNMAYGVHGHASSGKEAIKKVEQIRPDLVLMDIRLRGEMDGIETAEQIRTRFNIPVVYLTAHSDEQTLQRAKVTEPFGYICEPFDNRELRIALEVGLYKHRLERQRVEFLAMLTHDVKSPLTAILGGTFLLKEEGLSPTQEDVVQRLERSAQTILLLVNNYLDLSMIEAGYMDLVKERLQLNKSLRQIGRQYESQAQRRRITVELCLQEGLPSVEGDTMALERIFSNLLHNALKFTPEGGRVTVSTRQEKDRVVVAVADTGRGIAPEAMPMIFEKYWRATTIQRREGTGLGLFIVKALVEAHGGRVEVESTLGQGSCFAVCLPVA